MESNSRASIALGELLAPIPVATRMGVCHLLEKLLNDIAGPTGEAWGLEWGDPVQTLRLHVAGGLAHNPKSTRSAAHVSI